MAHGNDQAERLVAGRPFGAWVLKANPDDKFDIARYMAEGGDSIGNWTVQDNVRSHAMQPGDPVLFWIGGSGRKIRPGFWGSGTVSEPVLDWSGIDPDNDFWLDPDAVGKLHLFANVDIELWPDPISRDQLKADSVLSGIELMRQPAVGNPTYLTPTELAALQSLHGPLPIAVPVEPTGAEISVSSKGAGFGSPEKNRLVERAATVFVEQYLASEGWDLTDVSRSNVGWDLTAVRGDDEVHIELKGVSSVGTTVLLTPNELRVAREDPRWQIWVVSEALTNPTLSVFGSTDVMDAAQPLVYKVRLGRTS